MNRLPVITAVISLSLSRLGRARLRATSHWCCTTCGGAEASPGESPVWGKARGQGPFIESAQVGEPVRPGGGSGATVQAKKVQTR